MTVSRPVNPSDVYAAAWNQHFHMWGGFRRYAVGLDHDDLPAVNDIVLPCLQAQLMRKHITREFFLF